MNILINILIHDDNEKKILIFKTFLLKIVRCGIQSIYIEHDVMQQHQQQFTTVKIFGLLFKQSSDHALLRIKKTHTIVFM
jgi:hypothetical protein